MQRGPEVHAVEAHGEAPDEGGVRVEDTRLDRTRRARDPWVPLGVDPDQPALVEPEAPTERDLPGRPGVRCAGREIDPEARAEALGLPHLLDLLQRRGLGVATR